MIQRGRSLQVRIYILAVNPESVLPISTLHPSFFIHNIYDSLLLSHFTHIVFPPRKPQFLYICFFRIRCIHSFPSHQSIRLGYHPNLIFQCDSSSLDYIALDLINVCFQEYAEMFTNLSALAIDVGSKER